MSCVQGRAPAPRAAHASATLGHRGYICGGRVMVRTHQTLEFVFNRFNLNKKAQKNIYVLLLFIYYFECRKPGQMTFTAWILRLGRGQKCVCIFFIYIFFFLTKCQKIILCVTTNHAHNWPLFSGKITAVNREIAQD